MTVGSWLVRTVLGIMVAGQGFAQAVNLDEAFAQERRGVTETARWAVAYDFVERFADAEVSNSTATHPRSELIDAKTRPGIFQHPNVEAGGPVAELRYPQVHLPAVAANEKLILHFFTALAERIPADAAYDGCVFAIRLDGETVFRELYAQRAWKEWAIDLTPLGGETISISFLMDPLGTSNYDWAFWGRPRVLIEGRKAQVRKGPEIRFLKLEVLAGKPVESRIVEINEDSAASTIVAAMDTGLDLPAQLKQTAREAGLPGVRLGPELAAGEGPHPDNHTVVRILNRYGIAAYQFLAYPPAVRGGVSVNTGRTPGGEIVIVAAPLTDPDIREIRLFNHYGGFTSGFEPSESFAPPYAVAVGDFMPDKPGDEIALISKRLPEKNRLLGFFSHTGGLLQQVALPDGYEGEAAVSRVEANGVAAVLLYLIAERKGLICTPSGIATTRVFEELPAGAVVYPSPFDPDGYLAALPGKTQSIVMAIDPDGSVREQNIARQEELFWYQWYPADDAGPVGEGRYVRHSEFRHIRTDLASPALGTTDLEGKPPEFWAGQEVLSRLDSQVASYDSAPPRLWEPCFTHRMPKNVFQKWVEVVDEETGLPRYPMLTRNNHIVEYGEFDTVGFYASTYAFGLPELDRLYILPLRLFLRTLAVKFRANPEHFVALEPNHEHEIAVDAEGSMGDYNPRMIEGFYTYLTHLYGQDLEHLSKELGVDFGGCFDAPRDWDRADWDLYTDENPFYRAWRAYNRYIVDRRLAQTYREALLVGFPPETIKSHQIPDTYAIGGLEAFSLVVNRFTPIDYAMSAGVGYGFTRYGVWYKDEHNVTQGAHSSGFDMTSIGEYQALTPDTEAAYGQLRYIFENGGYSVHCMRWPAAYDKGFNAAMDTALRRLVAEDPPRPGVAGGLGSIRSAHGDDGPYGIAGVGAGPERNGLLKSFTRDGATRGNVYVVPFHAHIDVTPLDAAPGDGPGAWRIGPLDGLVSGNQVEVACRVRAAGNRALAFDVCHGDVPLPGLQAAARVGTSWRHIRYILRIQLPVSGLYVLVKADDPSMEVADLTACLHLERTTKLTEGIFEGVRHKGGVTFDVIEE